MAEFWLWFNTGTEHILDWNGYDHILYVMVLCVTFTLNDWKKLLLLITAFTFGHSLTLAISALNIYTAKQIYIETLIPLTILITCCVNIKYSQKSPRSQEQQNYKTNYFLALAFGFIHGLGFSYLLRSMLGKEENIILPLFSFNLGLEFGQIIIVAAMLLVSFFLARFTRIKKNNMVFFISSAVFGIAFLLFIQRLNDLFS